MPAKAGTQQGLKIAGGSEAQINKTDRNDARGVAQMMRVGLYRPVHVKTLRSQKLRMLLTHRKLLQSKASNPRERSGEDNDRAGFDDRLLGQSREGGD